MIMNKDFVINDVNIEHLMDVIQFHHNITTIDDFNKYVVY